MKRPASGLGLCVERAHAQRPDVDAPGLVGGEVVEPGAAAGPLGVEQNDGALGRRSLVRDVATPDDQPAALVQRDAADAAAMLDHRRDGARSIEAEHAAVVNVTEQETARGIPDRSLDQGVAGGELVHDLLPPNRR